MGAESAGEGGGDAAVPAYVQQYKYEVCEGLRGSEGRMVEARGGRGGVCCMRRWECRKDDGIEVMLYLREIGERIFIQER